jgi:acetyltransferase-like isoleucine patch superfamily enzyme
MSAPTFLDHDWFPRPLPVNVILGERTWLYSTFAFVHYRSERPCGLRVGHDTGIYTETFFDLGPCGQVEIGCYSTVAGPIISTNGSVRIGNYVLISREVVLADSFVAVPPSVLAAPAAVSANIVVGDRAWIGARAVLLTGACLAEGAIVGAGAVVNFAVPAYAIVAGNPARIVGWARPGGREKKQEPRADGE